MARLPPDLLDAPLDEQYDYRARQGVPVPFVEIRARGEDGELIPWDDRAMGELEVRGPWVAAAYHRGMGAEKFTDDGWFATGDVVKIDSHGCIRICDRSKDLVKSGGEWISSVDLENTADGTSGRRGGGGDRDSRRALGRAAAGRGRAPRRGGGGPDALREHLAGEFAKWQLPDRFEFIDALPRTATGKFKKTDLRERFVRDRGVSAAHPPRRAPSADRARVGR